MSVRVLLVAQDPVVRSRYEQALEGIDVACDAVASLGALHHQLLETPYNGLLLDLVTMVKAPETEKRLVHDLLEVFPVLRLRWDAEAAEVRALAYGQPETQGGGLGEFIERQCRPFEPRSIRRFPRREKHFNILLSPGEGGPGDFLRTTTVNVSEGGCFVYAAEDQGAFQRVRIRVLELADDEPIHARVRWQVPWGTPMRIPGLGLEFLDTDEKQLARWRSRL